MQKSYLHVFIYFCATQAGVGYLKGGGTIASAIQAFIIWHFFSDCSKSAYLASCFALFVVGYFFSAYVADHEKKYDPSCIVIDEMWGMAIALFGLPQISLVYFLAFLLFRFFDIFKPYPISALEKLSGGLGIMLDDGAAGLSACAIIYAVNYFFNFF